MTVRPAGERDLAAWRALVAAARRTATRPVASSQVKSLARAAKVAWGATIPGAEGLDDAGRRNTPFWPLVKLAAAWSALPDARRIMNAKLLAHWAEAADAALIPYLAARSAAIAAASPARPRLPYRDDDLED